MTAYHGGKQRIGKTIAKIIQRIISEEIAAGKEFDIEGYCEPFCGMLGVFRYIPGLFEIFDSDSDSAARGRNPAKIEYKAGDVNHSVIEMWKAAQNGWIPPTNVSEEQYNFLKHAAPSAMKGYIGHQYSFRGQYFQGYAPRYWGKKKSSRKASERVCEIGKSIRGVEFTAGTYKQFSNLKGFVIYCDPPYGGSVSRYYTDSSMTTPLRNPAKTLSFNEDEFWDWCRDMAKNNLVFVSGYSAPQDFTEVMASTHKLTGIGPNKSKKTRTEKLYVIHTIV